MESFQEVEEKIVEEYVNEDKPSKVYIDGFSSTKGYSVSDFRNKIKDLCEVSNINFLIGSGYCGEKLSDLGPIESLIEDNSSSTKDINNKVAIESLILYDFFKKNIFPHRTDIDAGLPFENSNIFILKLVEMLSKRNDKNLLKRINIFTTNYDMFFELSMENNSVYYNDGFSGRFRPRFSTENYNKIAKQIVQNTERESQIPTLNLYKLHGSLSWDKNGTEILYRNDICNILKQIEESAIIFEDDFFNYDRTVKSDISSVIETISEIDQKLKNELLDKVNDFKNEYNKLHIINPTKKKFEETLLSNVYYDLLRIYSNELEKNNSIIFVFGFSFKDEHIYSITKRALLNPAMIMYVFIYKEDSVKEFKEMFKEHHNVYYIYCKDTKMDLKVFNNLFFEE